MSKNLSIRDIAEMSGVSVATVSRVINNNGRFSEETRKRVQKIIDENGYVTNMAARSLRSSKSGNIGLILPDISNDFFSTLAYHTERELQSHGYSVFACNTSNDPAREQAYFKTLTSKLVDGIICISGLHTLDGDIVPKNLPIVCVDRYPENALNIPVVSSDEVAGMKTATQELIDHGCRRIIYVASYTADFKGNRRELGYLDALKANGIEIDNNLIVNITGKKPSMYETEDLISGLIQQGVVFDGIAASSDHSAAGALRALLNAGINVPEQVKLTGFDDSVYSRLTTPQITTVHRFPDQMAKAGCDAILKMLRGDEAERETIVPVKLVKRESSC